MPVLETLQNSGNIFLEIEYWLACSIFVTLKLLEVSFVNFAILFSFSIIVLDAMMEYRHWKQKTLEKSRIMNVLDWSLAVLLILSMIINGNAMIDGDYSYKTILSLFKICIFCSFFAIFPILEYKKYPISKYSLSFFICKVLITLLICSITYYFYQKECHYAFKSVYTDISLLNWKMLSFYIIMLVSVFVPYDRFVKN